MAQISLAWIMSRPGMPMVIDSVVAPLTRSVVGVTAPIVGTSSLDNLHDLLGEYFHISQYACISDP